MVCCKRNKLNFCLQVLITILVVFLANFNVFASEIIKVESFDGVELIGKLDLPEDSDNVKAVVIFVPGTGPCTYDNHRKFAEYEFNYFDLFAQEFTGRGVGFFRYSTRGTEMADIPPYFEKVDIDLYSKHLPSNHVRDVESIVKHLKGIEGLEDAKVILLGWSEGTIISPMVVERNQVEVDALFLAGYVHRNMYEIIKWQLTGGSSMVFYRKYFDTDQDGAISKEELEEDPNNIAQSVLQGMNFSQLDPNQDEMLTAEDFAILLAGRYQQVLNAFEEENDEWIWNNYFRITSAWYQEHLELKPNKERLLDLDLPIYIFHGVDDQNTPVEDAIEIKHMFEELNKDNLTAYIFENHDHDLNYMDWIYNRSISEGLNEIFSAASDFSNLK